MLPKNVLYYGKDEPLPEQIPLRAGPLSLVYENGDLRYIKLGDREIVRRIYVAIRDRNWGTVLPVFTDVQMDIREDSFRIRYDVENKQGELDFAWQGTITGDAEGTVAFTMDGVARSTFMKNRIGFCILHPAGAAGQPFVIEHVDGTTEESNLPATIVPSQPVVPFADMQALTNEVMPGIWAEVRFSGDVFEMEDQRNWTDASFKTFSTPLRIPYPAEVVAGTRIAQSVTLRLIDKREALPTAGGAVGFSVEAAPLTFTLESPQGASLPPIGLGVASHGQPLNEREIERLKVLKLHHLRVNLRLSDSNYPDAMRRATQEASALDVPLEVGLLISDAERDQELEQLRRLLEQVKPRIATWLVFPAKEVFWGGTPVNEVVEAARKYLDDYDPAARFAAGTNADLIWMLRSRPPLSMLDAVVFAILPQVHAFDNASVVETLAAQAATVTTARHFADNMPVMVSPVTFKMRANYYASGPEPATPPGQLPYQVDPRQMSLLGAGWTAGSVKYLSEAGVASLTYYETTGWRGVMETEAGSPAPDQFRSLPGSVFPLYHVLADVGEFAGGQVMPTSSSDALKVDGLAVSQNGRMRVLLANLSPQPQQVAVQNLGQQVRVRVLDETNVLDAMRAPEDFRRQEGQLLTTSAGELDLSLLPYAVARIDRV